jgi:hypothetical protein
VILVIGLAWLAVGLLVVAGRASHVLAWRVPLAAAWPLRLGAGVAIALGVWQLASRSGVALASAGMLLAVMACASIAALVVPLYPRGYVASVVVGGALTVLAAALR